MNYFQKMYSIDVSKWVEKKNGLSYVSWANAWGEIKKQHPDATYTIYENKDGWNYHTDGRTCWVKTGMMVQGIEHIEYLPVMDHRNASISADKVTSFDVNKAIQRSLTKAAARHGLGLYIYAGEDLPDDGEEKHVPASPLAETQKTTPAQVTGSDKPLTWQEQTEIICNVNRIKMDLFKDLFSALKQDGKFVNKTVDKLTPDEWHTLKPLIAAAVNATKPK